MPVSRVHYTLRASWWQYFTISLTAKKAEEDDFCSFRFKIYLFFTAKSAEKNLSADASWKWRYSCATTASAVLQLASTVRATVMPLRSAEEN